MFSSGRLSLIHSDVSIYDPYWSSVALLMAFENNLTDDSIQNQTVTGTGSIFYGSGANAKFDTYAVILNSGANYLNIANTSSFYFGTGDFTIETWMNPGISWGTGNVNVMDIAQKNNGVQGGPSGMFINTSSITSSVNSYNVAFYDNTAIGFVINPKSLASNTWSHICIGRQGSVVYIGAGGALSTPGSSTKNWFPYNVKIKQDFFNEYLYTARLDEFRVTKGVWRYGTGTNYTVPTARFPRQ